MKFSAKSTLRSSIGFKIAFDQENEESLIFDRVSKGALKEMVLFIEEKQRKNHEAISKIINMEDSDGKTPLFYASYYNQSLMALYLLKNEADITHRDAEGRNILHILCAKGNFETFIIVMSYMMHSLRKKLYKAVRLLKKEQKIKNSDILKGKLVSPNSHLPEMKESFHNVKKMTPSLYENYLDQKFKVIESVVMEYDEKGCLPIHYSAQSKYQNCHKITTFLLNLNFEAFFDDLHNAWSDVQVVDTPPDTKEDIRNYFNIESVLENFLDPELMNEKKKMFKQQLHYLKIKMSQQENQEKLTPLHISAYQGDYKQVQGLLDYLNDPNQKSKILEISKNSIVRKTIVDLHTSARIGSINDFDYLLKCGEDINERKTIKAQAPIHFSVNFSTMTGNQDLFNFIVESQANLDTYDCNGWTPLHYAAQNGDINIVVKLHERGAIMDFPSNKGQTPLHIAALHDQAEIIEYLLDKQASINLKDKDGCSPLLLASKKGHVKALLALLERSTRETFFCVDKRKWNALHFATYNGRIEATKYLRKWDTDYSISDEIYETEKKKIYIEKQNKKVDLAFGKIYSDKAKLPLGTTPKDINMKYTISLRSGKNSQGKTPKEICKNPETKFALETLWDAANSGNLDLCRRLISIGFNINEQTKKLKLTPLMLAVQKEHFLVVRYLLEMGADRSLKDATEKIAEDYCTEGSPIWKIFQTPHDDQLIFMIKNKKK